MTSISESSGSRSVPDPGDARVFHLMRPGVLTCAAAAPVRHVALIMAQHRVHFVVVTAPDPSGEGARPWGVVTDLAVAGALGSGRLDSTARELADRRVIETTPDEKLLDAARRMRDGRTTHLLVVQRGTGAPAGVLSTLDLAASLARGQSVRPD